jgi:hypothetical protein
LSISLKEREMDDYEVILNWWSSSYKRSWIPGDAAFFFRECEKRGVFRLPDYIWELSLDQVWMAWCNMKKNWLLIEESKAVRAWADDEPMF